MAKVREVEKMLGGLEHLKHLYSSIGKVEGILGQSSEGVYLAQLLLKFTSKTERETGINDILTNVRQRLKDYPGAILNISIPSMIGGQQIPVEMELSGDDFERLEKIILAVQKEAQNMGGFMEPDTSVREGKPELRVTPRRAILADLGASSYNLGMMLRANLEGIKAASYKSGARTYDIRVKLKEEPGKKQVAEFQIPTGKGRTLVLTGLTRVEEGQMPVQITRSDKQRVVKLFSNLSGEVPLGTAVANLGKRIQDRHLLPSGYEYRFRGDFERMQESGDEFMKAGLMAMILTYLALAAVLESFIRPFLILVTIPLALIGVFWALYLTGTSISIFVLLGCVMLMGIVVNNAVLILGHMQNNREKGLEPWEALLQSAAAEFRPIVMITLAAILGMLPLAVSHGLGSESGQGIGIASIGGIASSAVMTLLVIPVLYFLFTRKPKAKE